MSLAARILGSVFAVLGGSLLLVACATHPPISLDGTQLSNEDDTAVLWPYTGHRKGRYERLNHAVVLSVNGTSITRFASRPPVVLPPGEHHVEIRYDRDSYLCGAFGCMLFEQAKRQLMLRAEAGHSYLPLARKACGRDWIWIADAGANAREALETWRRHASYPQSPYDRHSPIKDVYALRVVAGEAPPEPCEASGE